MPAFSRRLRLALRLVTAQSALAAADRGLALAPLSDRPDLAAPQQAQTGSGWRRAGTDVSATVREAPGPGRHRPGPRRCNPEGRPAAPRRAVGTDHFTSEIEFRPGGQVFVNGALSPF